MAMAEQMKNLSEDILASYTQRAAEFQQRLKENAEFVKEIQETLYGFRKDQMEMAATLRANAANLRSNLAQGQKKRLESFDQMMSGIHGTISQIQDEVVEIKNSTDDLLKNFSVSHEEMATKLNNDLDQDKANRLNWNSGRLKEFDKLMKSINKEITKVKKEVDDIFGYTNKMLTTFSNDHGQMSATMKADLKANLTERVKYTQNLLGQFDKRLAEMSKENQKMAKALKLDLLKSRNELSKSDIKRIKDFNVAFSGIQRKVHEIQKFVDTFLTEFSTDRKQAAETWAKLGQAVANIGKSPAPTAKKISVEPEKPAVKKEEPKAEVAKQVLAFKKEEPKAEEVKKVVAIEKEVKQAEPVVVMPAELTLEQKVLSYINTHKNGVKVSEMEEPFGETRMRIGFITKKLLDEGKVQKTDNLYYPLA